MTEKNSEPKHFAVVTGASSGIGRATAEEFASRGFAVAVLARRKDLLEDLVKELTRRHPEGLFLAVPCNIGNWEQVEAAATQIGKHFPHLNVLVNNAGAFEYQSLEKSTPAKLDEMIDTNVRGVIYMSKALLPLLKAAAALKQSSKVVNVSSISGLWGFSHMGVYTATKFAVTGFSSALRREWRNHGIDVASIHPGPVRNREAKDAKSPKKAIVMMPDQIAKQIFELSKSDRRRHISHPAFSILNMLESFAPEFVDKVLKRIL